MADYHNDFWFENINYPNDAHGDPIYGEGVVGHPHFKRFTAWRDLGPNGEALRSEGITWVWIHPNNGRVWHLAGPRGGAEGVHLNKELTGVLHALFNIKYSEGPYIVGARPERVDWEKRIINLGVVVTGQQTANRKSKGGPFALRMIEDMWWQSWSETVPGYLGCFTRTHGWRWISLILGEAPKAKLSTSPNAHGNDTITVDMTVHAPWPFYAKRAVTRVWQAQLNDMDEHGICTGVIPLANRGTWVAHPKFLVRGHGNVTVQDGPDGRMVALPEFYASDGDYMLVDTDPSKRTITTEKDPVDTQLYKYLRNSQLLELLLHDTLQEKLPAQRRIPGGIGFDNPVPARTVANLKVTHDNYKGSVTVVLPQAYRMAWS